MIFHNWALIPRPPAYDPVLNNNTWAQIAEASAAGVAQDIWNVGDRKTIHVQGTVGTVSVNQDLDVFILGFNHNGSQGIDFGCFKAPSGGTDLCLVDSYYYILEANGAKRFNMNHSRDNAVGGWKGCDLRYDILGSTNAHGEDAASTTATSPVANTLMAALPEELRAVMKPMTIYTDNVGDGTQTASNVTASVDYLPLMSVTEVRNSTSGINIHEADYNQQYAYYASGNSTIKRKHNAQSTAAKYWTRSPNGYFSIPFISVDENGDTSGINTAYSLGLAPIFRV